MDINLHNYEAYFLDYHEGNLSLDSIKELMEFLSRHPELKEEFESFEPVTLEDVKGITYQGKDALKRQNTEVSPTNFDEFAIAYVEGTLPADKQQALKAFIAKNPQYAKELELYTKTKLVSDDIVVFDDKPSLKKGRKKPVAWYYWSAAASVAIIIGAYFMFNKSEAPVKNIVVQHTLPKDSNRVASHTVRIIDTANRKNASIVPSIHKIVHNHTLVARVEHNKKTKNENVIPQAPVKDSAIVADGKTPDKSQIEPLKKPFVVPVSPENNLAVTQNNNHTPDTSSTSQPLIIVRNSQPEVKKKKSKFLVVLATLTCKGLHKVTGQHIELEKQYAADTTTIVAYQLDLGNRKFEFPVKE